MLKPRKSVAAQTITRELQGAAVEPERRRVGDQVVIIVQQEGRIDSDAVVVPEADHQEQRRRQRRKTRSRIDASGATCSQVRPRRSPIAGSSATARPAMPRTARTDVVHGRVPAMRAANCPRDAASSRGPVHDVPASHQRQDPGAELLHADDEIVERQHDAAHARHGGQFVQHARDRRIRADEHALVGRQPVGSRAGSCAGLAARAGPCWDRPRPARRGRRAPPCRCRPCSAPTWPCAAASVSSAMTIVRIRAPQLRPVSAAAVDQAGDARRHGGRLVDAEARRRNCSRRIGRQSAFPRRSAPRR